MEGGFAGIIPAAGMSARMGAFKPLLKVGGVSIIKRTARTLMCAGASPVVIVTGFRGDEIEAEMAGTGVEFVRNCDYASSQQFDSVCMGLKALKGGHRGVIITPADVPCVDSESVKKLMERLECTGELAAVPVYNDKAGHPLVLDARLIPYVLDYGGCGGLRGALKACGCEALRVAVDDPATALDTDTPEDYARLLRLAAGSGGGKGDGTMRALLESLQKTLAGGRDAVIVTIIESEGSTPRKVGATMLADAGGRVCGTVGGGEMEYRCTELAAEVIKNRAARTAEFDMDNAQARDAGMICGGRARAQFAFVPAGNASLLELTDAALCAIDAGACGWLLTGVPEGRLSVYTKASGVCGAPVPDAVLNALTQNPCVISVQERRWFAQRLADAGRVYIFGGGHVSQSLVPALTAVGFCCVVLEDRPEFCERRLFGGTAQTRLIDMDDIAANVSINADDYVCVMTRGHSYDAQAQAFAMKTPARYIGVMGSRRKTAAVTARLKAEYGFEDAEFEHVTTPIGLDIGAQTPAEIAVSVTAQLIAVRAGRM